MTDISREDFTVINTEEGETRVSDLCGWSPELARDSFDLIGSTIPRLRIVGAAPPTGEPRRAMLYELARKVLGKDTDNYPQRIGDCTSFMGKNCSEYVQLYPIANGDRSVFTTIFPPYIYGCERAFVANQHNYSDGGVGAWVGTSVQKYGVLPTTAPNCPQYSKDIAKKWGYSGPPKEFVELGKQHIIRSVAAVKSTEDVKDALMNFYPVGVCSGIGYDMTPRQDGFNHYSTTWNHAMSIIGFDDGDSSKGIPECFVLLNNWGDVHGKIIDFRTKEAWPVGTLRISAANLQRMLDQNDSFAFSALEGFPAQDLPRENFVFI
jgi:hypothetical protein